MSESVLPLSYEPRRERRRSWRLPLVIVLAVALGFAGKLCWDKFAPVVSRHFHTLALQKTIEGQTVWPEPYGPTLSPLGGDTRPAARAVIDLLNIRPNRNAIWGEIAWAGRLQATDNQPRLVVILNPSFVRFSATTAAWIAGRSGSSRTSTTQTELYGIVLEPATVFTRVKTLRSVALRVDGRLVEVVAARWTDATPSQVELTLAGDVEPVRMLVSLRADDDLVVEPVH